MNIYSIYCSKEQTMKALELGAPIEDIQFRNAIKPETCKKFGFIYANNTYYIIPTAEKMIGFLRSKGIKFHFDDTTNYWRIDWDETPLSNAYGKTEQKELAAIDAALEYLHYNNKNKIAK